MTNEVLTEKFNAGDLVKLISGSPLMTVARSRIAATSGIVLVHCEWFDGAKLNVGTFDQRTLLPIPQELK